MNNANSIFILLTNNDMYDKIIKLTIVINAINFIIVNNI